MRTFVIFYACLAIYTCINSFNRCLKDHPREEEPNTLASDIFTFLVNVGVDMKEGLTREAIDIHCKRLDDFISQWSKNGQ